VNSGTWYEKIAVPELPDNVALPLLRKKEIVSN